MLHGGRAAGDDRERRASMAGMPVGPLSLNDEVAIDLACKIVKATKAQLGGGGRSPAPGASCSTTMVKRHGRLGRKNGKGFYDYPEKRPEAPVAGPRGSAAASARSRHDRRRGAEAALPRHAGAGGGAHASRRASSPIRARPMSARSSASASRPSPAARCPTSTSWARRPSSRCASGFRRRTAKVHAARNPHRHGGLGGTFYGRAEAPKAA